jgi:hypothetical protein
MLKTGLRYQQRLDTCLGKAATANTPELKELWHTIADSYRALLETESRASTYRSWVRNNLLLSNE